MTLPAKKGQGAATPLYCRMIDCSDALICLADEREEFDAATHALKYAKSRGVEVINVFAEND